MSLQRQHRSALPKWRYSLGRAEDLSVELLSIPALIPSLTTHSGFFRFFHDSVDQIL